MRRVDYKTIKICENEKRVKGNTNILKAFQEMKMKLPLIVANFKPKNKRITKKNEVSYTNGRVKQKKRHKGLIYRPAKKVETF